MFCVFSANVGGGSIAVLICNSAVILSTLGSVILLGERLIQYIMIASVVLIILFLLRGNQVMRSRNTHRPTRIIINVIILVTTLTTLAIIATMLYWV